MKLDIEVRPYVDDQFVAECKVPGIESLPIDITVVGMGGSVGAALSDIGRQLATVERVDEATRVE